MSLSVQLFSTAGMSVSTHTSCRDWRAFHRSGASYPGKTGSSHRFRLFDSLLQPGVLLTTGFECVFVGWPASMSVNTRSDRLRWLRDRSPPLRQRAVTVRSASIVSGWTDEASGPEAGAPGATGLPRQSSFRINGDDLNPVPFQLHDVIG